VFFARNTAFQKTGQTERGAGIEYKLRPGKQGQNMLYTLIVITYATNLNLVPTVASVPGFVTEKACKDAQETVTNKIKSIRLETGYAQVAAYCAPAGDH
jgi:hypothetical protein